MWNKSAFLGVYKKSDISAGTWGYKRRGWSMHSLQLMHACGHPSPPLSLLHHCAGVIALSADERGSLQSLCTLKHDNWILLSSLILRWWHTGPFRDREFYCRTEAHCQREHEAGSIKGLLIAFTRGRGKIPRKCYKCARLQCALRFLLHCYWYTTLHFHP